MDEINQWEYRVETFGSTFSTPKDDELEAALDEWGEDGWEVISAPSSMCSLGKNPEPG